MGLHHHTLYHWQGMAATAAGIILYMCPANERWRYNVTSSLIGWVHAQKDPYSRFLIQASRGMVASTKALFYTEASLNNRSMQKVTSLNKCLWLHFFSEWFINPLLIYHGIKLNMAYSTGITTTQPKSDFELTKDRPYLSITLNYVVFDGCILDKILMG